MSAVWSVYMKMISLILFFIFRFDDQFFISDILRETTYLINTDENYNRFMKLLEQLRSEEIFTTWDALDLLNIAEENMEWIYENYNEVEKWINEWTPKVVDTTPLPTTSTTARTTLSTAQTSEPPTTLGASSVVFSIGLIFLTVFVSLFMR